MAERGTRTEIDMGELEKLAQLQCTDEEIAAWFNVSTRTIERRRLEPEFAEVMTRGKAKGRISVRRMQMKLLEEGNATMGVWLGKQILGQADQISIASSVEIALLLPRTDSELQLDRAIDIAEIRGKMALKHTPSTRCEIQDSHEIGVAPRPPGGSE